MFEYIFGLIAPHLCISCDFRGDLLCSDCAKTLPSLPSACYRCHKKTRRTRICSACRPSTPLDELVAITSYQATAKTIVHKLKFERVSAGAETIASFMAEDLLAAQVNLQAMVVTYVPTAARRVRRRGYDQSARIAKHVARKLGLPCQPLLYRLGNTRQVGASKAQRKVQVQDIFRPRVAATSTPEHVILIDDVLTTGSTLEAAANTLRQAGAEHIIAVVFAAA